MSMQLQQMIDTTLPLIIDRNLTSYSLYDMTGDPGSVCDAH